MLTFGTSSTFRRKVLPAAVLEFFNLKTKIIVLFERSIASLRSARHNNQESFEIKNKSVSKPIWRRTGSGNINVHACRSIGRFNYFWDWSFNKTVKTEEKLKQNMLV